MVATINPFPPDWPEMVQYAIYENPSDFPGQFVVRKWIISAGEAVPTNEHWTAKTLEEARGHVPPWLACLTRSPEDDPVIVEVWI